MQEYPAGIILCDINVHLLSPANPMQIALEVQRRISAEVGMVSALLAYHTLTEKLPCLHVADISLN